MKFLEAGGGRSVKLFFDKTKGENPEKTFQKFVSAEKARSDDTTGIARPV